MTLSVTLIIGVLLISIVIILTIGFIFERRVSRLRILIEKERLVAQQASQELAQKLFNQWTETSVGAMRTQITDTVRKDYQVQLESWKKQEEKKIREDAIQKSVNTLLGKIGEEFSPVLLSNRFGVNLKDFRHLGTPVDFVAFKGLSGDTEEIEVIFLEIKSGESSGLVKRERRVRDAITSKRVKYELVNINELVSSFKSSLEERQNP